MEEQQSRTSMWGVSGTASKTVITINWENTEDNKVNTQEQQDNWNTNNE